MPTILKKSRGAGLVLEHLLEEVASDCLRKAAENPSVFWSLLELNFLCYSCNLLTFSPLLLCSQWTSIPVVVCFVFFLLSLDGKLKL